MSHRKLPRPLLLMCPMLLGLPLAVQGIAAEPGDAAAARVLRAGACAVDITPTRLPVIVNGGFLERRSDEIHSRLHVRCLVLDDGQTRLSIAVVDSCVIPRKLLDEAKRRAGAATGIPTERMLIAATHTHTAPSVAGALGSGVDEAYAEWLPGKIAEAIEQAAQNLTPAEVGWAVVDDSEHTNCRRWIVRPDRMQTDPFGSRSVRAMMHPGYQNPDFLGPAGPIDSGLSILSVRSADHRPITVLANYSMHYFGARAVSADYYGLVADKLARLMSPDTADPPLVAIMSQGTAGDLHWMDYSRPKRDIGIDQYAEEMAQRVYRASRGIEYQSRVPLATKQKELTLRCRAPSADRLAWAKTVVAAMGGRRPKDKPEIYAREQILLSERPNRTLKLQAVRIGDLGITAIPCEVFGITGLKIKAQSPLCPTFNMELANGAEGYIPPPAQHRLGGYTTWEARTACLEVQAEPRIVDAVLRLLEEVSGKSRRSVSVGHGPRANTVLASRPLAYWRMNEFEGPRAVDATGNGNHGTYEGGLAFYLEGSTSPDFSEVGVINRAPQFAGGRLSGRFPAPGPSYSVLMWFRNALPADARSITGTLFSRPGESLALGGNSAAPGKLLFRCPGSPGRLLEGKSSILTGAWHCVALVREADAARVFLDGNLEISGQVPPAGPVAAASLCIAGGPEPDANFEGRIDEVAIYERPLRIDEVRRLGRSGSGG